MNEFPSVSIITINYNSFNDTLEFLESVYNITYPNFEVILVDNNSEKFEGDLIREKHPTIIIIESSRNLGFAGANNLAIKKSLSEYLVFLNNDTIVEKDFLEPLIQQLMIDPTIGMISPKVKYYGTNTIQFAGTTKLDKFTGRAHRIGDFEEDVGQFDALYETGVIHGSAMVIPKRIIDEIGLMPEVYFLYYEELEWCHRAVMKGYKLNYLGTSVVYDKVSGSIGKNNPLKTYYLTRNRILYTRRNTSSLTKFMWLMYFTIISIPKKSFFFVLKGEIDHLKAFVSGILWNIKHFKLPME